MPQSFHELTIWKNGNKLVLQVYEATRHFPKSEQFGLTDQLKRSANSIIANIAESQGRYTYSDKIRVQYQSRGEIFETRSHLHVAHGLGYLTDVSFNKLDQAYESLLIQLNAYIKHLMQARSAN